MRDIIIEPEALQLMQDYRLPAELGFAKHQCPVMIEADYDNGKWGDFKLTPYRALSIDPASKVLHYAQEIFEGLKAYNVDGNGPFLFRPYENAKRFNFSAERMIMPAIDEDTFVHAVEVMTDVCHAAIPTATGQSLYLRPFMFATENNLGIKVSKSYKFLVLASPCGSYFDNLGIRVLVERENHRAFPGGTGAAKTGGNYAASLIGTLKASAYNCDQVMWLNAMDKKTIEELSGMNFFALVNEKLITPKLNGTVLSGITRESIIKLAQSINIPVSEENISIDELLEEIKKGNCTECFATGTAAIITPILQFVAGEHTVALPDSFGPVTKTLRACLLDIQEGRSEDVFEWRHQIMNSNLLLSQIAAQNILNTVQ